MNESLSDITPNMVSLDVSVLSNKKSLNKENDYDIGQMNENKNWPTDHLSQLIEIRDDMTS